MLIKHFFLRAREREREERRWCNVRNNESGGQSDGRGGGMYQWECAEGGEGGRREGEVRGHPYMTSALRGEGVSQKEDVVREVNLVL